MPLTGGPLRRLCLIGLSLTLATLMAGCATSSSRTPTPTSAPTPARKGLVLAVAGNHLVNAQGQPVVLRGVNRSGSEYMCVQHTGEVFDGPDDAASVEAMLSWHINVVRIGLNEDCWLGINGASPGGPAYQTAIESYVHLLNAHGLYAILELHWTAPGPVLVTAQENLPDYGHAVPMWASVAAAFKDDPAVAFDLFNEPNNEGFSGCAPGAPQPACDHAVGEAKASNEDGDWWCGWSGTGCITGPNSDPASTRIASMQDMLDAVRGTGATNVVLIGADQFANDPSGWLAYAPHDPLHQLAMSFHVYQSDFPCVTVFCWNQELLPIASKYPVVTGEVGESDGVATFIDGYMSWADQHQISYLAWVWDTWGCGDAAVLIQSYSGSPCPGYGAGYEAHLQELAGPPSG